MQLCQIIFFLLYVLIVLLIIECGLHIRSHRLQYPRSIADLGLWRSQNKLSNQDRAWSGWPHDRGAGLCTRAQICSLSVGRGRACCGCTRPFETWRKNIQESYTFRRLPSQKTRKKPLVKNRRLNSEKKKTQNKSRIYIGAALDRWKALRTDDEASTGTVSAVTRLAIQHVV